MEKRGIFAIIFAIVFSLARIDKSDEIDSEIPLDFLVMENFMRKTDFFISYMSFKWSIVVLCIGQISAHLNCSYLRTIFLTMFEFKCSLLCLNL